MFLVNSVRYCYLLEDLTPELLESKSSSYEDLRDYLRTRGREAYFQKTVSFVFVLS
jgi:preprotein translocase subunit SecA